MNMIPSLGYVATAALFSFTTTALAGYPAAAIFSAPGFAPSDKLWFSAIFILGTALTIYSAIPKSASLLQINWLVIFVTCVAMYLIALTVNPDAVLDNTKMVVFFSIFTLGSPLWLPLVGFILHAKACSNVED
jgi:hypothetical protein